MRFALIAVADDGDALVLDKRRIGIGGGSDFRLNCLLLSVSADKLGEGVHP
jgi:hypothetical protein